MTEAAVELRDVFCVHRTNEGDAAALQGATLDLAVGEVLCVLGPSGAGKSTLLRVIAGIQTPSAGAARVLGRDIGRLGPRARARLRHQLLGFLGQRAEETLAPDLPVRDSVMLPLALRGIPRADRRARVDELLATAGLDDRADALAEELSGGERQRFALCAALAHRPAVLLADEPTGELDGEGAAATRALIADLARSDGTSVIVASHDAASGEIADRTVRIRDGRVVEDRRQGESALVVGRGGWVRLPARLRSDAGIDRRAHARPARGGLLITPASAEHEPDAAQRELNAAQHAAPRIVTPPRGPFEPAVVRLESVSRGYRQGRAGRAVIDAFTLELAPGRLTVVTGRSGTGKTTLLRLVAGLDRPDTGRLRIDGDPLDGLDAEQLAALRRERIGYLPQEPSPVGFLSAEEDVVLVLRMRGWDVDSARERAATALAGVGLAERAQQRVHRLSAGETQRVGLARALASARGLLIVDEPTSRLDESGAATVAGLLAVAAAGEGQTVICATHDPEVIERADELITLAR